MTTRAERESNIKTKERHQAILKELMMRPENRRCADCGKRDPRWASHNLGIFFCIRCSGVHRSLGTHISKVKSADLDTWTDDQVLLMCRWGNARANAYWQARLPPNHAVDDSRTADFIRDKYQFKRFVAPGPLPEPETLGPAPVTLLAAEFMAGLGASAGPAVVAEAVAPAATGLVDLLDPLSGPGVASAPAVAPGTTKASIMSLFSTYRPSGASLGDAAAPLGAAWSPAASSVASPAAPPASVSVATAPLSNFGDFSAFDDVFGGFSSAAPAPAHVTLPAAKPPIPQQQSLLDASPPVPAARLPPEPLSWDADPAPVPFGASNVSTPLDAGLGGSVLQQPTIPPALSPPLAPSVAPALAPEPTLPEPHQEAPKVSQPAPFDYLGAPMSTDLKPKPAPLADLNMANPWG